MPQSGAALGTVRGTGQDGSCCQGRLQGLKLGLQPGLPRAVLQSSSCSPQGSWPAQGMCHLPGTALSLPGSSPWTVGRSWRWKEPPPSGQIPPAVEMVLHGQGCSQLSPQGKGKGLSGVSVSLTLLHCPTGHQQICLTSPSQSASSPSSASRQQQQHLGLQHLSLSELPLRPWCQGDAPGQCPVLGGVCRAELSPQGWAGLWQHWQGQG